MPYAELNIEEHATIQVSRSAWHDRRLRCCPRRKLLPGSFRFALIQHMLRRHLSPEQNSGKLKSMIIPDFRDAYVCRETIYSASF